MKQLEANQTFIFPFFALDKPLVVNHGFKSNQNIKSLSLVATTITMALSRSKLNKVLFTFQTFLLRSLIPIAKLIVELIINTDFRSTQTLLIVLKVFASMTLSLVIA